MENEIVKDIANEPTNIEQTTMCVGESAFFHNPMGDETTVDNETTWSSDNPAVATVNEVSGLVYAQQEGETVIRANGAGQSYAVTVTNRVLVEDIILSDTHLELNRGDRQGLSATICPSNASNKGIRWCSGNENVVVVDSYNASACIITGNNGLGNLRCKRQGKGNSFGSKCGDAEFVPCVRKEKI